MQYRYLSPDWFAAAQQAVAGDQRLRELTDGLRLTLEQTVTGAPDGLVRWHVVFDDGDVRLTLGPTGHADVRFRANYEVAVAIARGQLAAPIAFIQGNLAVRGDLGVLTTHQRALAALHDVLGDLRQATTFPSEKGEVEAPHA